MSRRRAYVERPQCAHVRAEWDAYHEAERRHFDRSGWDVSSPPTPRLERPTREGYCAECWQALCQSREPWPAEVWAYLDHCADNGSSRAGSVARLKGAPKLPPDPKPRSISPAKWIQLAIDHYKPETEAKYYPQVHKVIGQAIHAGDQPYKVTTTNGHCLLAEPGEGHTPQLTKTISVERSGPWIDLPADFQLALKRVRIFASDRTDAVRIAIDRDFARIILHARDTEGEATEYLDNGIANQSPDFPEGYEVCLSATYLDAIGGCWPIRWHVRENFQAQLFCPAKTDARVLIMPMRI